MERKNYTVAIDLGSSNVVVAVGRRTDDGMLEVASLVSKPVEGVNAGRSENIELVGKAIREAVRPRKRSASVSRKFMRASRANSSAAPAIRTTSLRPIPRTA